MVSKINTKPEAIPVGGGFSGQIAKKGVPGKVVEIAARQLPPFLNALKIENMQKSAEEYSKNFLKMKPVKKMEKVRK